MLDWNPDRLGVFMLPSQREGASGICGYDLMVAALKARVWMPNIHILEFLRQTFGAQRTLNAFVRFEPARELDQSFVSRALYAGHFAIEFVSFTFGTPHEGQSCKLTVTLTTSAKTFEKRYPACFWERHVQVVDGKIRRFMAIWEW